MILTVSTRISTDIFVQTFNRLDFTKATLEGIIENTSLPFRLIVVDNHSTDGTVDYLSTLREQGIISELILNPQNTGLMIPKRQAFALVKSDYFVVTDNDTVPPRISPDWLSQLIALMDASPQFAQIAPRGNGTRLPDGDERVVEVRIVPNIFTLTRKSAIESIGGYPDILEMREDDAIIASLLRGRGWRLGRVRDMWANHLTEGLVTGQHNWGYPADWPPSFHGHSSVSEPPRHVAVDPATCQPLGASGAEPSAPACRTKRPEAGFEARRWHGVDSCLKGEPDAVYLIINNDDFGLCRAVNRGTIAAYKSGVITSSSLMIVGAAAEEAIAFILEYPQCAVGIHITLTNFFMNLTIGPVSPPGEVASLVSKHGYFKRTVEEIQETALPNHVEREARAQIERAMNLGINISHLDNHMLSIAGNPENFEFAEILFRLAEEYKLPVINHNKYFGHRLEIFDESEATSCFGAEEKLNRLVTVIEGLRPGLHCITCHIAEDAEELNSLHPEYTPWARDYRVSDSEALYDERFRAALEEHQVVLFDMHALRCSSLFSRL